MKKTFLFAVCIALLLTLAAPCALAEGETIDFLGYEEALTYFDFTNAATNWCTNFGMDTELELETARAAVIAGTSRELIVRLATYARDTGHGDEPLIVTTAFRPACYQAVIGLHDGNANTGPFRNALKWNGYSVTGFWWQAEEAPGWPEAYALDFAGYDLNALDPDIFYRAALRLWDNTWASAYYAKPGCSAHNSGCAMDIMNYWIGANFATSYEYNGKTYAMEDYGLYKPLQPGGASAGETWHITCVPSTLALGNYDLAFNAGGEIVYALYFNPVHRGWSMADGRGLYIGAGVTVIQLRLFQLGLLEKQYITGFYCTKTAEAVLAFQEKNGLKADGICGSGTIAKLFSEELPLSDSVAPSLDYGELGAAQKGGFLVNLRGSDDQALNAFRIETRMEGESTWISRLYNAPASGSGSFDVDIRDEGTYEVRAAAVDKTGNESAMTELGSIFVDTTAPQLRALRIYDIADHGFALSLEGSDNGQFAGFTLTLREEKGETREQFLFSDGSAPCLFPVEGLSDGVWEITVTALDACGNESSHTFLWKYDTAQEYPGYDIRHFGA